jgi:hypothetical protein
MAQLTPGGAGLTRLQDAPPVHYVDGSFYLWRTDFVRGGHASWSAGRTLMHLVESSGSIDTERELRRLEALIDAGIVALIPPAQP